jgi:hypothetical protein
LRIGEGREAGIRISGGISEVRGQGGAVAGRGLATPPCAHPSGS